MNENDWLLNSVNVLTHIPFHNANLPMMYVVSRLRRRQDYLSASQPARCHVIITIEQQNNSFMLLLWSDVWYHLIQFSGMIVFDNIILYTYQEKMVKSAPSHLRHFTTIHSTICDMCGEYDETNLHYTLSLFWLGKRALFYLDIELPSSEWGKESHDTMRPMMLWCWWWCKPEFWLFKLLSARLCYDWTARMKVSKGRARWTESSSHSSSAPSHVTALLTVFSV